MACELCVESALHNGKLVRRSFFHCLNYLPNFNDSSIILRTRTENTIKFLEVIILTATFTPVRKKVTLEKKKNRNPSFKILELSQQVTNWLKWRYSDFLQSLRTVQDFLFLNWKKKVQTCECFVPWISFLGSIFFWKMNKVFLPNGDNSCIDVYKWLCTWVVVAENTSSYT